jgi:hypothetical protein
MHLSHGVFQIYLQLSTSADLSAGKKSTVPMFKTPSRRLSTGADLGCKNLGGSDLTELKLNSPWIELSVCKDLSCACQSI